MTGVATAIGVGVATLGAGIYSANKAASAQENAANAAQQTQQSMFDQTNANQAPFRQAGVAATQQLGGIYGLPGYAKVDPSKTIQNLPGYQFQLGQGIQAVDRSAAAQGLLNSGATGKALTQYGQGLAGNYFSSYVGGLQSLAGLGEGATQATSQAGQSAANQISSAQIYSGNAQAQGDINSYNAIASGIDQGVGIYGKFNPPTQPQLGLGTGQYGAGLPGGYSSVFGNPNAPGSPFSYQALVGNP